MRRRILFLVVFSVITAALTLAQQAPSTSRWTFNVGGGFVGPTGDLGKFTSRSYQGGAGAGINLGRLFAFDGEYAYYHLGFKDDVIHNQFLPGADGHMQSGTLNLIVKVPMQGKLGFYGIVGGGWYRRSVEANSQNLVKGTVCQPAWALWQIDCTNNLITASQTLSSHSLDAGGYNYGGGLTYKLKFHGAKFYMEGRYHHANHSGLKSSMVPITFGLRW